MNKLCSNKKAGFEKLEELAKKNGDSMYKIAKETDISQATLSDWKNGKYVPKIDKLMKLASYFGVSVDYFIVQEE